MRVEVLYSEKLTALQLAFGKACAELGLSNTPSDKGRLEHLAMPMVSLIEEGEANLAAVRKQAVFQMRHPNWSGRKR